MPRSSGTCTRCPLEINLTDNMEHDGSWICKVYLYKNYHFDSSFRRIGATRSQPLGPWAPQEPEDIPFATLNSKEGVPEVLKWAQLATLNPSKSPDRYKPGLNSSTPQTIQVKFSPNCVRLDVSHLLQNFHYRLIIAVRFAVLICRICLSTTFQV